jgi:DNA-binding beta-propeller fold protein YncE
VVGLKGCEAVQRPTGGFGSILLTIVGALGAAVSPGLPDRSRGGVHRGAPSSRAGGLTAQIERWVARYAGARHAYDEAAGIAVSPDGRRLFVTGDAEETADTRSLVTLAYDSSDGGLLWSARHSAGAHREAIPLRIVVGPDGRRVFVTGSQTGSHGSADPWDYITLGYSASTGAALWTSIGAGPGHGADTAEGLGVSRDGRRVFVTGTSLGPRSDRDFLTVAYSTADGSRLWSARFDSGADDFATQLAVAPSGSRVYVAGFGRRAFNVPHSVRVVSYDAATGARVRSSAYNDGADDYASDLALSRDGTHLFVTGVRVYVSGQAVAQDVRTVGFDASLRVTLSQEFDGGQGNDSPRAVAVSPRGDSVYVTGESDEGRVARFGEVRSTAAVTIAYDAASGTRLWVARYPGLGRAPDTGLDVVASPRGTLVFVIATSDSGCSGSDVATLAYGP